MKGDKLQKERKNIAVAGCGHWGKNLIRSFAELGALHTICDSNPQTLNELGQLYPGVKKETQLKKVLSDAEIDGVVISTPAALHYSMAKQVLEAGKDVFVEKPLAFKLEEGETLVKLAAEKKRILMVGHLLEYHPGIIKLKEMVRNGELGRINYIYSSRLNLGKFRTEENILWSFAPHDISVILLLLDEMPQTLSANGGYYLHNDLADVTVTTMSFRSGANAHIFVSWLHPFKEQKLVVVGDKNMVVFDDVSPDNKLTLYQHQIEWVDRVPKPRQQKGIPVKFNMVEPLKLECQHFLDCLLKRQQPITDGASGLRVLRVLDACQKSLEGHGIIVSLDSKGYFLHPSSLVEEPVSIGEGTRIWHFCHVMANASIGKGCNIGQNVFIAGGVIIGSNVKIQNNVSVYEGVVIEDDVFCGPSCVFTNVRVPRSHISQRGKYDRTLIKKGATIGANSTIVGGNDIGKYAFIGAGAVVTRDVPDYALVYGNPARIHGWVCECGTRLDFSKNNKVRCSSCGQEYTMRKRGGEPGVKRTKL